MDRADLIRLRRARDRIDRDYAERLDVPALAAEAFMSVGHFPEDQFYGVRDCAFRDPAGNMVRFNQTLAQPDGQQA